MIAGQPLFALVACIHALLGMSIRPERLDDIEVDADDADYLKVADSLECADGSTKLTADECKAYATKLGKWFSKSGHPGWPKGCLAHGFHGIDGFYYNSASKQDTNGQVKLICKPEAPAKPQWARGDGIVCPSDYKEITDWYDCEMATGNFSDLEWHGTFTSDNLPPGCEAWLGQVQFNKHTGDFKGVDMSPGYVKNRQVLCKREASDPAEAPEAPTEEDGAPATEYHLAPMGADTCDFGETPRHWDCKVAAKVAIEAHGIHSNGEYQESAWPHVPFGCSVREGNGKTHYSHLKNGKNNGVHQLVCSGARKAKPVGFCFDLEPPSTWGDSTCATIAASVKSNPSDNYCKNRDNTSSKLWNQVQCAKTCDGCKWTTTWDSEPPSTWGDASCAKIAASIKSNPDDNYCRNRGQSGKPWNDVYCAKTCIGIEGKPPDRRGQNCGPGCDWKGKFSGAKGGVCDWCGIHDGQKMACCRKGYSDPGCAGAEGEHQWFHSCVTLSGSVVKTSSAEEPPEDPSGSGGLSRPLTFVSFIVSFILGLV